MERALVGRLVRAGFLRDRRGGPWPPPAHLPHEALRFPGNSGADLAGDWFPAERPRGVAVLAHPDRRYAKSWFAREGILDFLHQAGFDVLAFDFAGYGESHGGATYFHEDVLAAVDVAKRWSGGLPVHVLGVSMGAFAAANAAPRFQGVEGLVLESPYPSFNAWYGASAGGVVMAVFDRLFPRSSAAIQADRNIARASAKRILVAAPANDAITPAWLSRRVAEAAPPERTRYLEAPDAAHLEPFAKSTEYRAAMLETFGVDAKDARAYAEAWRAVAPQISRASSSSPSPPASFTRTRPST